MAQARQVSLPPGEGLLDGDFLHFTLKDGYVGVIASEERRTYEHIIHSNLGRAAGLGLTDAQVKAILSKSHLLETDLEHVWSLTTTIQAGGLADGNWSSLEVFVALHFIQAYEHLNLNDMAVQFAGSFPPVARRILRRTSYAQAGPTQSTSTSNLATLAETLVVPRSQSVLTPAAPPSLTSIRHAHSDARPTSRARGLRSMRSRSSNDAFSLSQAGLEALNAIHEIEDRPDRIAATPSTTSHQVFTQLPAPLALGVETIEREGSVRSNTADQANVLARLIKERCPQVRIGPDIEAPGLRVPDCSILDRTQARDILVRIRKEDPNYPDPYSGIGGLLKPERMKQKAADTLNWTFGPGELSRALKSAIESGFVGVTEALLDMGADINFLTEGPKHKLKGFRKAQPPRATDYFQIAASSRNVEMVGLLASRGVTKQALDKALKEAVQQNSLDVAFILLQYGADPNAMLGRIFESAVTSQNIGMVKVMLRARIKVQKAHITNMLPIAVSQGQRDLAAVLVAYGADVNYDGASGLRTAVQSQRVDLVLTLMKGKPRSEVASAIIEDTASMEGSIKSEERYLLTQILLCAGATGAPVARTLVHVTRAGYRGIARLLVMHGASIEYNGAEALVIAIKNGAIDMLRILLLGEVSQDCASRVFQSIPHPFTRNRTYDMMTALVVKGASGLPLDRALVASVRQKLINITNLLLDNKANVNYNDAQALQSSASVGDLDCLNLLLSKGRPRAQSMQHVLPLVPFDPPRLRYDMTKAILNVATSGSIQASVLDAALVKAVEMSSSPEIDLKLVILLIAAGAKVDCLDGLCFRVAVQRESADLLGLLLAKVSQTSLLSPAVTAAMRVGQPDLRRKMMAMILDHGGDGSNVDKALVDAVGETRIDENLIDLLLTKGDVDYDGGQVISRAVQKCTVNVLSTLVEVGKPCQSARLKALMTTLNPAVEAREKKAKLLLRDRIRRTHLDTALVQEIKNGPMVSVEMVEMLLAHKATCNHDNGEALKLAICNNDNKMLEILLRSKPDSHILGMMLPHAMQNVNAHARFQVVSLLVKGGAKGEYVSQALHKEVLDSNLCHPPLVHVLVQHGAAIDYSDAAAIKAAVSKPLNTDILKFLVSANGSENIIPSLIPLAMKWAESVRLPLLQILLETGACGYQVDAALIQAVCEGASSLASIKMLLHYKASVNFERGKAVKHASSVKLSAVLDLLLRKSPRLDYLVEALPLAMQVQNGLSSSGASARLLAVQLLTRAGVRACEAVHLALIQAIQQRDHALVSHLIDSGGNPNFNKGLSVREATKLSDLRSLELLLRSKPKPTPGVFSDAFSVVKDSLPARLIEPNPLLRMTWILLEGGASGSAVDSALASTISNAHNDNAMLFINVVLSRCTLLDVNFDRGRALCTASRVLLDEVVKELLSRRPTQKTLCSAFMSVLESDPSSSETSVIAVIKLFTEHAKETKSMYFKHKKPSENALYKCLHYHGEKPELLTFLLENGCSPNADFLWTFLPEHGTEKVSSLLWFICQGELVDRRVVDILLKRGVDVNFRTSFTGHTPLIVAASSAQPDLVQRLIEAGAEPDTEDYRHRTALYYATKAQNVKCMEHLLKHKADPNDESLHLAAANAKYPLIKLLLGHGASVNYPGNVSCEGRTALGELCYKAHPDKDPAGVKGSLKVFHETSCDYRHLTRNKSLVMQALDNDSPLSMTRALLNTFLTLRSKLNSDFNIFRPRSGKHYSLTMYVRHYKCIQDHRSRSYLSEYACCSLVSCPGPALEKLLHSFGCEDRFWDENAGANQPPGACGLPSHIIEKQHEAARLRVKEAAQACDRAERAAQRAARKAEQDADAADERRRENDRLALKEEERRADAREERRRISAIEDEHNSRRALERRTFEEQQERQRIAAQGEEDRVRRRDTQRIKTLEKEAKIQLGMDREKQRTIDKAAGLMREAQIVGASGQGVGRILGEIEDGAKRLM